MSLNYAKIFMDEKNKSSKYEKYSLANNIKYLE